jgi:hypothetical protein
MKDRNMEDIDQLFRKGLSPEEVPITLPEGEWENMELRLNRYDRRKRGIIWLVRLGSVAALVLLFFALGVLITDKVPPVDEQAMVNRNDQAPHVNKSNSTDSIQATHKAPEQLHIQKLNKELRQEASSPKQAKKGQIRQSATNDQLAQNRNQQPEAFQGEKVENIAENTPLQRDTVKRANTAIENTTTEPVVTAKEQNPLLTDTAPPAHERSSKAQEPLLEAVEEPVKQPMAEHRVPKMALSVMAAPAYNGVNNLNNGSMGGDFGLLVSLEIARNLNVSTGGIYAKKLYETGFRDYNPKNNIWHEYYPQTVNADCRVLDIPVNLSYTFFKAKGRTINMGTGLSSYIMLREDYRFTYAETDPDTPLAYRVVNENRHWLSVVNLQASIEQRLSKRISISLQPYMKIPLADIGFAGVKLQSMGMAANLSWNFNL